MSNEQRSLEVKVGLFVFIGLMAIAIMAVQFGRMGQGLKKFYSVTVEFPNASGLIKDAQVQLAGAVVGQVADIPQIRSGHIGTVFVELKIQDDIKIPVNAWFVIGSSGLLGDKFVQIAPPADFDPKKFNANDPDQIIKAGSVIQGTEEGGFNALTKKGDEVMGKLNVNLEQLKTTLNEVNTKLPIILSDENLNNLKASFASIKTTGDNFAKVSGKLDSVVVGAQSAVDSAKETMATARQTMASASAAVGDVRGAIGDVRVAVQQTQGLIKNAQTGPGTVPMLLGNREVADNLRALISNIRRHGLLFYRDSSTVDAQAKLPPSAVKTKPNP